MRRLKKCADQVQTRKNVQTRDAEEGGNAAVEKMCGEEASVHSGGTHALGDFVLLSPVNVKETKKGTHFFSLSNVHFESKILLQLLSC